MNVRSAQMALKAKNKVRYTGRCLSNLKGSQAIYRCISALIYRYVDGKLLCFAELLDISGNSVRIVDISEVENYEY